MWNSYGNYVNVKILFATQYYKSDKYCGYNVATHVQI